MLEKLYQLLNSKIINISILIQFLKKNPHRREVDRFI